MSIASRITSIEGHIEDIYDTLALGGDTTSNKNIVNINTEIKREYKDFLANRTDTLWNNWEKVSGEGTELTLNNTMEGKMKIELKGNTQQDSTTGKQLFDKDNATILNAYIDQDQTTITSNYLNRTTYVKCNPNTTYTCSSPYETYQAWGTISVGLADILPQIGTQCYGILNNNGVPLTITTGNNTQYIVIRYKGGRVDIKDVKDYIQVEEGSQATNWEEYTGGIPSPNPDYPQDIQIVSGDNTIKVANGDNTEYEEYPISLGNIELCKIGTYQDSIVKDNGKWYLNKQIGKVVLNGSENWQVNGTGTPNYFYYYYSGITTGASNLYCNYYNYAAIGATNTDIGIFLPTNYVRIRSTTEDTIENFKTWLSAHNTTAYYVLATPTNTEITDTTLLGQLNNLYNANSYEGTTNVSQVNDDMPFILDLTCLKEMS